MVSQNVILFPTTIYENVRYGKWEASKDEIVEACKNAKIHEFIMGLPEKYDTLVGEKGILLSGGERQRISIARALSVQPEFVVCDEPISALDVSLQAQIVQMLQNLQEKYGLTYLFISHQLQVVQKICDEIGVLYLGNLMEIADADKLYSNPLHPYTKMLISSIPIPDPRVKTLDQIVTDTGVQSRSIGGCRFHNRCPWCEERCRQETPALRQVEPGHMVACHKYQEKK